MKLDGTHFRAIQSGFIQAFSGNELAQFVRLELNENPEVIAAGDGLDERTHNLIAWAERNDRVVDLLQRAATARPNNGTFAELAIAVDKSQNGARLAEAVIPELHTVNGGSGDGPVENRSLSSRRTWVIGLVGVLAIAAAGIAFALLRPDPVDGQSVPAIKLQPLSEVAGGFIRHVAFTEQYLWLTVKKDFGKDGETVGLLQWDSETGSKCLYRHLLGTSHCQAGAVAEDDADFIGAIWADETEIYAGINLKGVVRGLVDAPGNVQFSDVFALPQVQVMSLHKDQRGYLWAGTNQGVYRSKDSLTERLTARELCQPSAQVNDDLDVRDIAEDAAGIWLATDAGAIFLAHSGVGSFCHQEDAAPRCQVGGPVFNDNIWSVEVDSNNTVWVGTADGWVGHLERASSPDATDERCWQSGWLPRAPELQSFNQVWALEEARDGTLWAAAKHGIFMRRADGAEWKPYPIDNPNEAFDVECLFGECAYGSWDGLYMTTN